MTRTPVVSREQAEALALAVFSAGFSGCYDAGGRPGTYVDNKYVPAPVAHEVLDTSAFGELPEYWSVDAQEVISEWDGHAHALSLKAKIEAFETTPGIRAKLLALFQAGERGLRAPRRVDLSSLAKRAQGTTDQWGKKRAPWTPDPACTCRLKLAEAVAAVSTQEAYADHSVDLVPYEGEIKDVAAARSRLAEFLRRADSHTGWAGSGANWSVAGIDTDAKCVVVFCRASIAD